MIIGLKSENTVLEQLKASAYKFYLTGSRFFDTAKEDSDWDFFTVFDPDLCSFLKDLGFEEIHGTKYKDDSTISAVYRYIVENYSQIDIQICYDQGAFERKQRAQEKILKSGIYGFMSDNKPLAKRIWHLALLDT